MGSAERQKQRRTRRVSRAGLREIGDGIGRGRRAAASAGPPRHQTSGTAQREPRQSEAGASETSTFPNRAWERGKRLQGIFTVRAGHVVYGGNFWKERWNPLP